MKNWNEKLGGVASFGVLLYVLSARFGTYIPGIYIFIAFVTGSGLILVFGNRRLWGKKPEHMNEDGR